MLRPSTPILKQQIFLAGRIEEGRRERRGQNHYLGLGMPAKLVKVFSY